MATWLFTRRGALTVGAASAAGAAGGWDDTACGGRVVACAGLVS